MYYLVVPFLLTWAHLYNSPASPCLHPALWLFVHPDVSKHKTHLPTETVLFIGGTLGKTSENQEKKKKKKLKNTLKRKLNPIIRCEGGRKFFFPAKIMYSFKIPFSAFYACKISDTVVKFVLFFCCHQATFSINRLWHYV